jgi:hypothetical protein
MPRKRKPGPRTKSGRLSKAHKRADVRDFGTEESQAKRHAWINSADPQLGATASGILFANGMLSEEQYNAAMRYSHAHALVFGKVWTVTVPIARELPHQGSEAPENLIIRARERIDRWNALLTYDQREAVANVAVFGFIPQFFYTERLGLRPLPSDAKDKAALVEGLQALAD